jgi:hypothetical protein
MNSPAFFSLQKRGLEDYLPWFSLDTVRDLRPFLRREANTRRPFAVCIRSRNPCLLILFLLWG